MKLREKISHLFGKKNVLLSILAAAILIPVGLNAWGPSRPTFTIEKPATYVTFNSMTNNPVVGDERQFVGIKDNAHVAGGGWQKDIAVQPGKEYLVRVYVHNNAAANLNLEAINTRVTAALSTKTGKNIPLSVFIDADNAKPKQIHADVNLKSDKEFNIAYIPGSAKLYNNATGQAGRAVSDSIVNGGGALIGYNANDGKLKGCFEFTTYLTFKVKPQFASGDFSIEKKVSKKGANKWVKNYKAQPGETVDYLLKYKNNGSSVQNNVVIKDALPKGATYVNGSSILGNPTNPKGVKTEDTVISKTGINVGSYNPGQNAWLIFSAKMPNKEALECGVNKLVNTETVITDYGTKEDTAIVEIEKDCPKPKEIKVCDLTSKSIIVIDEKDFNDGKHSKNLEDCKESSKVVYTCDMLAVQRISRTKFEFKTGYSLENATLKNITYIIRDADGKEIAKKTTKGSFVYEQTEVGKYTVHAFINVTSEKGDASATSVKCQQKFEVKAPPVEPKNIKVCDLTSKKIVVIDEKDFDDKKHTEDLKDCEPTPVVPLIKICEITTKTIVSVTEEEINNNVEKYTKDLSVCNPQVVPQTPSALPQSGLDSPIVKLFGLGSLVATISYYIASRRSIIN